MESDTSPYRAKKLLIKVTENMKRSKPKILIQSRQNNKINNTMKKITLLMLIVFTAFTVHSQNKLLSSIQEISANGTWTNNSGENYEYDSNNNLITEISYNWDNGAFKLKSRTAYSYNINNRIIQSLHQELNLQTNQLENWSKDIYTYTNNRITGVEFQNWISSNWVNDYKIVVTYNTLNLPDIILYFDWQMSQWVNDERTTYECNANNKISTSVDQDWVGSQWVNSFKSIYVYNSNNKIVTERGANWNVFNNNWVEAGASRIDYVFDLTGNRSSMTRSGNFNYKEEYSYDASSLMSTFAHPFKDKTGLDYFSEDFPYVNKLLTMREFNFNSSTNAFEVYGRKTYNYNSSIILSIASPLAADATISVYPNPAEGVLYIKNESNIDFDKVTITDLSGKIIMEQVGNKTAINIENFAKGMYVLEVMSGGNKMVNKFIKN